MAGLTFDPELFRAAARVTLGYFGVYGSAILFQVFAKVRAEIAVAKARSDAKKAGNGAAVATFDRYRSDDPLLLVADRTVGNMIEWMGLFLAPLWIASALAPPGTTSIATAGWAYVAARAAYPLIAVAVGGVSRKGARPQQWLSTVPGYAAIGFLVYQVVSHL